MATEVNPVNKISSEPNMGSAGLKTQVSGSPTTISAAANATGGIGAGHFIDTSVEEQIFSFRGSETPTMDLFGKAKRIAVDSPVVEHYLLDEPRTFITTTTKVNESSTAKTAIPVQADDQSLARANTTLLVEGVDGYAEDGRTRTVGKPLMVMVTSQSADTGNPIVMALNGKRNNPSDLVSLLPEIPAGTKLHILSTALSETQKHVEPSLILPQSRMFYLQKRGFNTVVSDYFDKQKKRIPFTQAIIAESAIMNFKKTGNRSFINSRASKVQVDMGDMGVQLLYTCEGIRWQFLRVWQHLSGRWSVGELFSLLKLYYTGEDVPTDGIMLCGKDLLQSLQQVDYKNHPEINISSTTNTIGWAVTRITSVFGSIDFKHEPSLDALGLEKSGFIVDPSRLVHYVYSAEHSSEEEVEGHEAKRTTTVVWDAPALKGTCHIWIDGNNAGHDGSIEYTYWDSDQAPTGEDLVKDLVYYLTQPVAAIDAKSKGGELWQYDGSTWNKFSGKIFV